MYALPAAACCSLGCGVAGRQACGHNKYLRICPKSAQLHFISDIFVLAVDIFPCLWLLPLLLWPFYTTYIQYILLLVAFYKITFALRPSIWFMACTLADCPSAPLCFTAAPRLSLEKSNIFAGVTHA